MSDPVARYHRLQLVLAIAGVTLDATLLAALAWSGGARAIAATARQVTTAWWLEVALVALAIGAASAALGFPLAWLRGYRLPRRHGLLLVVVDQSRKSRTANAALTGLGRTRRIILFDTLVAEFTPAEIESVLAHELAHHVHGDFWRGMAVQGAVTLASFWATARVLRATAPALGLTGVADPAGLPWVALLIAAAGLAALPVVNGCSRRMERRADNFALANTDPEAFVGAMERLAALNLAERRPSRLKEILLSSHPSLDRRIARAHAARVGLEWRPGRAARPGSG